MLPEAVVEAAIEDELDAAVAWAKRYGIEFTALMPVEKIVRADLIQKNSQERFFLQGQFDQYKALPPLWSWRDSNWSGEGGRSLSPKGVNTPFGSSMFILHKGRAIICAPFSRSAFGDHDGPHRNWGGATQWTTVASGYVHAVTIGDMLQAILRDFRYTTERMG